MTRMILVVLPFLVLSLLLGACSGTATTQNVTRSSQPSTTNTKVANTPIVTPSINPTEAARPQTTTAAAATPRPPTVQPITPATPPATKANPTIAVTPPTTKVGITGTLLMESGYATLAPVFTEVLNGAYVFQSPEQVFGPYNEIRHISITISGLNTLVPNVFAVFPTTEYTARLSPVTTLIEGSHKISTFEFDTTQWRISCSDFIPQGGGVGFLYTPPVGSPYGSWPNPTFYYTMTFPQK